MTMHDLLNSGLIKDTDRIRVVKPITGNLVDMRDGFWFNDQILAFHNQEVTEFMWNKEKGWTIALAASEVEPVELPF